MNSITTPYSWGDIADTFASADGTAGVPGGLVKVEIYWDSINLTIESDTARDEIGAWLTGLFPQRIEDDHIILDGPDFSRNLPVNFSIYDEDDDGKPPVRLPAQFVAASTRIWFKSSPAAAPVQPTNLPTFAFHSVKGGVGRTTSAISFTKSLVAKQNMRPLLVDADFEAPGISYLFLNDGRESVFSFEDLMVLAHADEDSSASPTIEFGANKIRNQTHEGITILPCLRSLDKLSAFAIRPEQLQKSRQDEPFFVLGLLQKLARRAGCDCLIVDLRAGFTDLAAMILCAPGVAPVFVTTPSGQAVDSTRLMLNFIAGKASAKFTVANRPAVIVNNVIPQVKRSADFSNLLDSLERSTDLFIQGEDDQVAAGEPIDFSGDEIKGSPIVTLDHAPSLTASASRLTDFLDDLRDLPCFEQLSSGLEGWTQDYIASCGDPIDDLDAFGPFHSTTGLSADIRDARKRLAEFAESRIFADSARDSAAEFMLVRALAELSERFKTELPNATCIGMKGAGKTFTFRLLAQIRTWEAFLAKTSSLGSDASSDNKMILPVLPARNLQNSEDIINLREDACDKIGVGNPIPFSELHSLIDISSKNLDTDSEWSDFWLDVIAWSAGFSSHDPGAGRVFVDYIHRHGIQLVVLFDGLEETFQQFRSNPRQQAAIRGLTSALPQFLLEIPRRPIGIINFVRSDLIAAAYPNNYRQFADRNKAYALTWFDRDILDLAGWVLTHAGIGSLANDVSLDEQTLLVKNLHFLLGEKLGKPDRLSKGGRTREAKSSDWVIAALSDLRGRISARDLLGFISTSASLSIHEENSSLNDRLLLPRAMSKAIATVGALKIEAMGEENPALEIILQRLKKADQFAVPLELTQFKKIILDLTDDELKLLEDNGILLIENNTVEMPEIFRTGMGNVVRATGGRKSIIGLMKRAKLTKANVDII